MAGTAAASAKPPVYLAKRPWEATASRGRTADVLSSGLAAALGLPADGAGEARAAAMQLLS